MLATPEQFKLTFRPYAAPHAVVQLATVRFTVLTDRLIRLEYHPEGHFEDRASQAFWFREQPVPEFRAETADTGVEIETEYLHLRYTGAGNAFTAENLSILIKDCNTTWHPGDIDDKNLLSTTRTLDFVNGYTSLRPGLMSRSGWSVLDDSTTLVFNEAGWIEPRIADGTDIYFFGFGTDYKACLRDYCAVSGKTPMIPRWALGNWWSRYWHYTQDELTQLINDFDTYELPFSVCIIDMDWHITNTGNTSTGWTGYTWNRELFPDPQGILNFLHEKNLRVSMNLHPAEGVHPHEEQYEEIARAVNIDPLSLEPVLFNISDPAFAKAYFDVLHRPHEKMGVDFWWIDWQQGQKTALPGLDPLWLINHLHFYDQGRDGVRRPFIFSRWGEQGHQRYPIGFSGDSYATWDSLNFQPYMTAAASNIAYGYWSHDIGGHTSGEEDPELYARWVQFGVFSPINRIHATKGFFYDRRPWAFEDAEVLRVLRDALQLRHAFIPYIYTMAWRAHNDSLPLMLPMYYEHPDKEEAYNCPQQYMFGSELIAAPFVSPADEHTNLSRQVVWLPEGDWTHFFTGEHFAGNQWHAIYGRLEDIPLFARAGAIVPLGPKNGINGASNPDELHVHLFAGADNTFTLYEDDGETTQYLEGHHALTTMTQIWQDNALTFMLHAPTDETLLIPQRREVHLVIHGVREKVNITAQVNGTDIEISTTYDTQTETLSLSGIVLDITSTLVVSLKSNDGSLLSRRDRKAETVIRLLRSFKLNIGVRNRLAEELDTLIANPRTIAPYLLPMTPSQGRALFELLYEAGVHFIEDTDNPVRLIMWDNNDSQDVTYRYGDMHLQFGRIPSLHHENGIVPKFKAIIPEITAWSHGALREHVQRTQWQLSMDYDNLFTVIEEYTEDPA